PLWRRVAFATCLVFAVVLLLLPVVLPWRALVGAGRREVLRAGRASAAPEPDQALRRRALVDDLVTRGTAHRRFVGHADGYARLTAAGTRLEQQICDARAAAA